MLWLASVLRFSIIMYYFYAALHVAFRIPFFYRRQLGRDANQDQGIPWFYPSGMYDLLESVANVHGHFGVKIIAQMFTSPNWWY